MNEWVENIKGMWYIQYSIRAYLWDWRAWDGRQRGAGEGSARVRWSQREPHYSYYSYCCCCCWYVQRRETRRARDSPHSPPPTLWNGKNERRTRENWAEDYSTVEREVVVVEKNSSIANELQLLHWHGARYMFIFLCVCLLLQQKNEKECKKLFTVLQRGSDEWCTCE